MEHFDKEYCLEVWGDLACFTRPELKVERVSYDVITPSAARAIFESIFWKPAIRWQVTRIEVLNPIRWTNIKRNEVGKLMSPTSDGLIIEDNRQQRSSMLLRDVRYRIFARQIYIPVKNRPSEEQRLWAKDENPGKYNAMFQRRASKGQCFNQPYLGCREFSCGFQLIEPAIHGQGIDESRDLGLMLYDMDFKDQYGEKPAEALFYRAKMEHGVIVVPEKDSEEVLR
ncbi:MAG: type I-C CRISPR-associated protein Cas5c [Prevotellaceae bacterium]|nr:type I-C CRISPR-associated protein Cas5c [Prevotellaceae bacterium]